MNTTYPTVDECLPKARAMLRQHGYLSYSPLQRACGIGFNRATQVLDRLVELGEISRSVGPDPRFREVPSTTASQ